MENKKYNLSQVATNIYRELLNSKGKVVSDKQLIAAGYGKVTDLDGVLPSMRSCISFKIRPYALMDGYKIIRTTGMGYSIIDNFEEGEEEKKKRKLGEFLHMFDDETGTDDYDTLENLSIKTGVKEKTIKDAQYRKRWCARRYFFRSKEDDPIPEIRKRYTPSDEGDLLKSYAEKIREAAQCMENRNERYFKLDKRTRVMFRKEKV